MPGCRQSARVAIVSASAGLALAVGGCGEEDPQLAQLVPPDTPLYAEAAILPDDERSEAIASLSSRIAGIDDPRAELISMLDAELEAEGVPLTYAEDVEPWLGEAGAVFVRSFEPGLVTGDTADAALLLEATDPDRAQEFVDELAVAGPGDDFAERTYEGVDYRFDPSSETVIGVVEDAFVVGTEASLKAAVDATGNHSLADAEDFSKQAGGLDDENVAELWLNLGMVLDAAAGSSDADDAEIDAARAALGSLLSEPIAVSVAATPETVSVETSAAGGTPIEGDTDLLGQLPGDAWFAAAVAGAGDAVRESIDGLGALGPELGDPTLDPEAIAGAVEAATGLDLEDDILSWVGDAAFYVAGTSEASVRLGALLETTDPAAATEAISAARELFERQSGARAEAPRLEDAEEGFAATAPTGGGLEVVLRDGLVVAGLGGGEPAAATVDPGEPLSSAAPFTAAIGALGDEFSASVYVALQDFLVVAEQGDEGDTDYGAARPYTDALDYLVFGTAGDGDRERTRIVVGIGE